MPRKVFVAGEILTAADLQANAVDQSVMVFDDAAARTTAIPTPTEGMVTYLKDTDAVEKFDGSAFVNVNTDSGKILQVVQGVKSDTFSTTSTSLVDITGLSATITPTSASSKVLVFIETNQGASSLEVGVVFQLVRGSTAIGQGDAAGSRLRVTIANILGSNSDSTASQLLQGAASKVFLDSPATTSATTYKVQMSVETGTAHINRNDQNSDASTKYAARPISTITLMEVAG